MPTLDIQLLHALLNKYQTLRALRFSSGAESADSSVPKPRARLAALAAQFPGALRELDRLPMAIISARIAELEQAVSGASEVRAWMPLQIGYHGFMRAVLRIRRSLLAQPSRDLSDPLACLAALLYQPALDEPAASRFDSAALHTILKPPAGRLNPWVLAQVARDHGVSMADVQAALWLAGNDSPAS